MKSKKENKFDIIDSIIPDSNTLLYASKRSKATGTKILNGRYISVNELDTYIKDCLNVILNDFGFKYLKSTKEFKRKFDGGVDVIYWLNWDYTHYHFQFYAARRIDEIQKMITKFNFEFGYNRIDDYKKFYTAYSHFPEGNNNVEIKNLKDLKKMISDFIPVLSRKILPAMSEMENAFEMHKTYNGLRGDNPFNSYNKLFKLVDNILISELVNDKDTSNKLRELMKTNKYEQEQRRYKDLEKFLKKNLP